MTDWIVGLDLRADCDGAVRFARWLAGDRKGLLGVHVVETEEYPHPPAKTDLAALRDRMQPVAEELVAEAGASDSFEGCIVRTGPAAERVLPHLCAELGAQGIVVGRRGRKEVSAVVRLGRVARRLLRWLPVPIVVVRPDLETEDIGAGPVVVATDLRPDSEAACKFAAALAARHARPLLVVHVMPTVDEPRVSYIREALRDSGWLDTSESKQHELDAWLARLGIEGARTRLEHGDPVERLLATLTAEQAPIVVTGSRRLTIGERLFGSSVASALASLGSCPVAVIPPQLGEPSVSES